MSRMNHTTTHMGTTTKPLQTLG